MQMLDRQRVQQAAADEAKKLVDAAALASERLVDATKEAEETATAAAAAAAAAEETATAAAAAAATFDDFGVQQVRGLLEIYRKDMSKGGHCYPALLSDSTLPQYEVYKKLVWEHYRCCCRTWPHLRCSWPRGIRLRKFCVFVAEYTKFYVLKSGVLKVTLLTFFLSLLYSKMHLMELNKRVFEVTLPRIHCAYVVQ